MKPPVVMFAFVLIWLSVGCTVGGDPLLEDIKPRLEDDPRLGEAVDTVCFTSGLSGFHEIGNQAVVLRRSANESYVARTGYCRSLRQVEGLRLPDSGGCLKRGDRLEVYDQPFPRAGEPNDAPERCLVTAIHRWQDVAIGAPFYE